jgi:hypothetical protein
MATIASSGGVAAPHFGHAKLDLALEKLDVSRIGQISWLGAGDLATAMEELRTITSEACLLKRHGIPSFMHSGRADKVDLIF